VHGLRVLACVKLFAIVISVPNNLPYGNLFGVQSPRRLQRTSAAVAVATGNSKW